MPVRLPRLPGSFVATQHVEEYLKERCYLAHQSHYGNTIFSRKSLAQWKRLKKSLWRARVRMCVCVCLCARVRAYVCLHTFSYTHKTYITY